MMGAEQKSILSDFLQVNVYTDEYLTDEYLE